MDDQVLLGEVQRLTAVDRIAIAFARADPDSLHHLVGPQYPRSRALGICEVPNRPAMASVANELLPIIKGNLVARPADHHWRDAEDMAHPAPFIEERIAGNQSPHALPGGRGRDRRG